MSTLVSISDNLLQARHHSLRSRARRDTENDWGEEGGSVWARAFVPGPVFACEQVCLWCLRFCDLVKGGINAWEAPCQLKEDREEARERSAKEAQRAAHRFYVV